MEAGGVGILSVLKTRNLLIFLATKNAQCYKIAPNWNVSGTRLPAIFDRFQALTYNSILQLTCEPPALCSKLLQLKTPFGSFSTLGLSALEASRR